jgi:hypothetical protein
MTWVTRYALERGTALHKACELDDQGDLEESSVDSACTGFLKAWRKFKADTGAIIYFMERPVYSALGYAGTIDRGLVLNGKDCILDLKCNALPSWIGLQLGAYARAAQEFGIGVEMAFGLALRSDGTYRLKPVDCAAGLHGFLQALEKVRT